ncbi:hypothetical protein [Paenibacillus sp. ISL-20]|uniref:hypothetical protein n=1 Tax=Paenibacillus sp. ISL-20 TaxID=2819163 RepID=UPI001BEA20AF|nr:hypothetical protein [Paenibacillus sp. ISL-20]MBT2764298.1 hypothetical protein [Paenibacillus sp. ISL-20]
MRSQRFKHEFNENLAKKFYQDIRCGILHQAQTKGNSQLSYTSSVMVERIHNGIRVNVLMFSEALIKEFEDYIRLLEIGNRLARENFLKKMQFIVDPNDRSPKRGYGLRF